MSNESSTTQSYGIGIRNPIVICIAVVAFLFWLRMIFIGRADSIFTYYFILVFIVGGGYLYLLPSIIALSNRHPDFVPILLANLFLGATGLVWFGTLFWATRYRLNRY